MAQHFQVGADYPLDPEALFELMVDPIFQEERALGCGALEATCSRAVDADGHIVIKLFTRRPPLFGSKPDASTMILRWDPERHEATWRHIQHGQEKRSRAEGTTRMLPRVGGGCRLETEGELELRVPVVGPLIERKVVQFVKAEQEREIAWLHNHVVARFRAA